MEIVNFFADFFTSFPYPTEFYCSAIFAGICIFFNWVLYSRRKL